jgi:hypothetical protein
MDSFEIPEGILPVEDNEEILEKETPEKLDPDFQEQEIFDLIFPADRTISVNIYAYISRVGKKVTVNAVMDYKSEDLVGAGLEVHEIRSLWTTPTAAQMDEYRQECSEYRPQSQSIMVNNFAVRDLIVVSHLKELLLPPKYKPFPLKHTRPDRLSGDTVKRIKSMHSGIYDVLYTKFISESCLIT